MTKEQQTKHLEDFQEKQLKILLAKGDDYSGDDRLSNFKKVAQMVNISPEQVALTLIGVKVARLGELLQDKKPKNESIEDSLVDLANYAVLLDMIRADA